MKKQEKQEMRRMKSDHGGFVLIHKKVGQTPLEAIESYRKKHPKLKGVPLTYAGRLDPLASGILPVLIGDECMRKDEYTALDKEYEVEILFGIETDTYDVLGLVERQVCMDFEAEKRVIRELLSFKSKFKNGRVIEFLQSYPPFSGKVVGGRKLFELARAGKLPEVMPKKKVTLYSCRLVSQRKISSARLLMQVERDVSLVKGDFRQKAILRKWCQELKKSARSFPAYKMRVWCSSGTYMRSLAHKLGKDAGVGALALSIKRLTIGSRGETSKRSLL